MNSITKHGTIPRAMAWLVALALLSGCTTLPNTYGYSLKYKRGLEKWYARMYEEHLEQEREQEKKPASGATQVTLQQTSTTLPLARPAGVPLPKSAMLARDATAMLPELADSDAPFILSELTDARDLRPIMVGEPLNVLVNQVHVGSLGRTLLDRRASVAVVLTVDDGVGERKTVLSSFEEGVVANTTLPSRGILAYSTDSYDGQPIRIQVDVIQMDSGLDRAAKSIFSSIGRMSSLPIAGGYDEMARSAGQAILAEMDANQLLAKFVLQIYPSDTPGGDFDEPSKSIGIPRAAVGTYVIFAENACLASSDVECGSSLFEDDTVSLHGGFDYSFFSVPKRHGSLECRSEEKKDAREMPSCFSVWPSSPGARGRPIKNTHVVFSVQNMYLSKAGEIIAAMNAGLGKLGGRTFDQAKVDEVTKRAKEEIELDAMLVRFQPGNVADLEGLAAYMKKAKGDLQRRAYMRAKRYLPPDVGSPEQLMEWVEESKCGDLRCLTFRDGKYMRTPGVNGTRANAARVSLTKPRVAR